MTRKSVTPPLRVKGIFKTLSPFEVSSSTVYTCEATKTIPEMLAMDVNVLTKVYTDNGLTEADYNEDVNLPANIITLTSVGNPPLYIPSTYIESYPDDSAVDYENIVISASLGALPATIKSELSQACDIVAQQLAQVTGVKNIQVSVNSAPSTNAVSAEQHRVAEANRLNAIQQLPTDHAELLRVQSQLAQANETIKEYEGIITDLSSKVK